MNPASIPDAATYEEYDIGDDYTLAGNIYEVTGKHIITDGVTYYYFYLSRVIPGEHHSVLVNYWNVYNYSFLEWNFLREERRLV